MLFRETEKLPFYIPLKPFFPSILFHFPFFNSLSLFQVFLDSAALVP